MAHSVESLLQATFKGIEQRRWVHIAANPRS